MTRSTSDAGVKKCPRCSISKLLTDFRKNKTNPDGLSWACSICEREIQRVHYQNNKEKVKKIVKEYCLANKEIISVKTKKRYKAMTWQKRHLTQIRCRANKRGLAFDLEESDLIYPNFCPVLGIPLNPAMGFGNPNSPSVDRIDNTKGYTKDNICIISNRANSIKRDANVEELKAIVAYMEAHHAKGD